MTKQVSLSVNDEPIALDYFVLGFVDHVVDGMMAALQGTGKVGNLELSMDEGRQIKINLNNAQVPVNPFVNKIIGNTLIGMVSTLKGVGEIHRLKLTIKR